MERARLSARFAVALSFSIALFSSSAIGGLIDYKPGTPGVQSASWPANSVIMIFMDGLMGDDRKCFEDGVKSWDALLDKISVQFKDGNRPAGAGGVQISLVPAGSLGTEQGNTAAAPFFPAGSNTGILDSADIKIDTTAQGKLSLLKNLGAHEFGHVLGFDDDPRTSGPRTSVMDPDFDVNSPVIGPSEQDKAVARLSYSVIPLPPAVWTTLGMLLTLGVMASLRMRRA